MIHLDDWIDRALTKSLETALQNRYTAYAYILREYREEGEPYVCVEVVCPDIGELGELVFEGEYPMFGTYISTILKDIAEALDIEEPELKL